jgi:tetratricopeptide (TPR) repeat protein
MHFGAGITGFAQADGVFLDDPLPSKINLGVSYKPIRPLSFVADISQPLNLQSIGESALLSFGGGMALQITPFFALHSGFFLSGGNPRFSLGSEFMLFSYLANVNYTLDLTSSINPISRFSLALKMNLGDKGRKSDAEKVDEFYVRGLEAYYLLHLEEAIRLWEEALEIDPGFDPAIIAIKAAQATIDIQEKIRDIQKLE